MDGTNERRGWRDWGGKAALALGGLLVGGVLVGTLTASAADTDAGSQNSASQSCDLIKRGAYGIGYDGLSQSRHAVIEVNLALELGVVKLELLAGG